MSVHQFRSNMTPLLDDFKKANGKGSVTAANTALIAMVELLINHIESITPAFSSFTNGYGRGAYTLDAPQTIYAAAAVPAVPNGVYPINTDGKWNPPINWQQNQPPMAFGPPHPVAPAPGVPTPVLEPAEGTDDEVIKPAEEVPAKRGRGRPKKGTR